jgi:hypothetical protein
MGDLAGACLTSALRQIPSRHRPTLGHGAQGARHRAPTRAPDLSLQRRSYRGSGCAPGRWHVCQHTRARDSRRGPERESRWRAGGTPLAAMARERIWRSPDRAPRPTARPESRAVDPESRDPAGEGPPPPRRSELAAFSHRPLDFSDLSGGTQEAPLAPAGGFGGSVPRGSRPEVRSAEVASAGRKPLGTGSSQAAPPREPPPSVPSSAKCGPGNFRDSEISRKFPAGFHRPLRGDLPGRVCLLHPEREGAVTAHQSLGAGSRRFKDGDS